MRVNRQRIIVGLPSHKRLIPERSCFSRELTTTRGQGGEMRDSWSLSDQVLGVWCLRYPDSCQVEWTVTEETRVGAALTRVVMRTVGRVVKRLNASRASGRWITVAAQKAVDLWLASWRLAALLPLSLIHI